MRSLIQGYEYDVFVSYRHRDNRYDGWVTAFVSNLRKELDATFKDQVSIYFDENPHDGINEVDVVDETIDAKIKCLVFIPVLSQTYCDPKSFAWNNEFLAFRAFASGDQYKLNITLPNGNRVSRIIPVRIHDLDDADRRLVEAAVGGPLRSVEFVYKAPGVNRPLRATEDRPLENLSKVYYRDQVNKIANLVKGIISTMQSPEQLPALPEMPGRSPAVRRSRRRNVMISLSLVAMLAILVFFFLREDLNKDAGIIPRQRSLAVLPFKVIGDENADRYFADGVMEAVMSNLSYIPDLKVKPRTSVEQYYGTKKPLAEIAKELGVTYILEGSAQKDGEDIRVIVRLVDSRTETNVWSSRFDRKVANLFDVENEISETIAKSLEATLTPDIARKIRRVPTPDFEAYDLFLRSRQLGRLYASSHNPEELREAVHLLRLSLRRDSLFAQGYAWLAGLKTLALAGTPDSRALRDSIVLLAKKALAIDSTVVEADLVLSEVYFLNTDDINALRFTYRALEDPTMDSLSVVRMIRRLASVYSRSGMAKRAVKLYDRLLTSDPGNLDILHSKFYALESEHQATELLDLADAIGLVNPYDIYIDLIRTTVSLERKELAEVERIYQQAETRLKSNVADIDQFALVYAFALKRAGKQDQANGLVREFERHFGNDSYYRAQVDLFRGRRQESLKILSAEEVGWYNLNLCLVNPLFDPVRNDTLFVGFVRRNADRITGKRNRIYQLEAKGYLPDPEKVFR